MKKTGFLLALLLSMAGFGVFAGAQEDLSLENADIINTDDLSGSDNEEIELLLDDEDSLMLSADPSFPEIVLEEDDQDISSEELTLPEESAKPENPVAEGEETESTPELLVPDEDIELSAAEQPPLLKAYGKTITRITVRGGTMTLPLASRNMYPFLATVFYGDGSSEKVTGWENISLELGGELYIGLHAFTENWDELYAYTMLGSQYVDFPLYGENINNRDYTLVAYLKENEQITGRCSLRFVVPSKSQMISSNTSILLGNGGKIWLNYLVHADGEYLFTCRGNGDAELNVYLKNGNDFRNMGVNYNASETIWRSWLSKGTIVYIGIAACQNGFSGTMSACVPKAGTTLKYSKSISCSVFDLLETLYYLPMTVCTDSGVEFRTDKWVLYNSRSDDSMYGGQSAITRNGDYISIDEPVQGSVPIYDQYLTPQENLVLKVNNSLLTDDGLINIRTFLPEVNNTLEVGLPKSFRAQRMSSYVCCITAPAAGDYTLDVQTDVLSGVNLFSNRSGTFVLRNDLYWDHDSDLWYDDDILGLPCSKRHTLTVHLDQNEQICLRVRTSSKKPVLTGAAALYRGCLGIGELPVLIKNGQVHVHSYQWFVTRQATCLSDGMKEYRCSCGNVTKTEIIPKGSHRYGSWIIIREATTRTAGEKHRTCSVCGNTERKAIARKEGYVTLSANSVEVGKGRTADNVKIKNKAVEDMIESCIVEDKRIAEVTVKGDTISVKGLRKGSTVVTVKMYSNASAQFKVTVSDKIETRILKILEQGYENDGKFTKDNSQRSNFDNDNNSEMTICLAVVSASKIYQQFKIVTQLSPLNSTQKIEYQTEQYSFFPVFKLDEKTGIVTPLHKGRGLLVVRSGNQSININVKVWSQEMYIGNGLGTPR